MTNKYDIIYIEKTKISEDRGFVVKHSLVEALAFAKRCVDDKNKEFKYIVKNDNEIFSKRNVISLIERIDMKDGII